MPGHGIKQSAKNASNYVTRQIDDTIHRFDAEPGMKAFILRETKNGKSKSNALKDIASLKRVRLANRYIKNHLGSGDTADWQRRTRNNELAKSVALYAAPVAVAGAGLAAYKKIKGRKEENKMEKMSAEQYTDFVQKLAGEIADEVMEDNGMEVMAGEGLDADEFDKIAERAYLAYESAQMRKEAAEADYAEACAYEDAAMLILEECED